MTVWELYQMLGELAITLPTKEEFSRYRRALDLDNALATVTYQIAGVKLRARILLQPTLWRARGKI